jgi:hypothetical protein
MMGLFTRINRSELEVVDFHSKVDHSQVGVFSLRYQKSIYKNLGTIPIIFKDKNNTKKVFFLFMLFLKKKMVVKIIFIKYICGIK